MKDAHLKNGREVLDFYKVKLSQGLTEAEATSARAHYGENCSLYLIFSVTPVTTHFSNDVGP
jgi:hypothetical protein